METITQTKFTPGPWKHAVDFRLYEKDVYNMIIAGGGYNSPLDNARGFSITGIITDADAKLITASPVMYDAITKCQEALAEWIVPDSGISDTEVLSTLLGILDAQSLVKTLREINK